MSPVIRPALRRSLALIALIGLFQIMALPAAWASHLELGQVEATDNAVGATADYTTTFRIGGGNGNLPAGEPTIRITFPAGFDVTDVAFDAAASGVREGTSDPFGPFPAFSAFEVDAGARQAFIRDIDYATTAASTMFRVVLTGADNATTSGNHSFQITVLNSSGGTNTNGFVTFALANGPLDTFAVTDTALDPIADQAAGQPFDVRIRALDAFGNLVNGTAGGDDFTGTVAVTSNVAGSAGLTTTDAFVAGNLGSHSVTLTERSDGAATLTATNTTGSEAGTSAPFTVTHGPADHLAISVQPSDTTPGSTLSPAVEVEVRDEFGNRVLTDTGTTVTAALGAAPDGAVLGGTTSRDTVEGVATFDDLAIQPAGTGYTLRFAATGFDAVDSEPFDIGHPVPAVEVSSPTSTADGFTFDVTNHDDRYLYSVESDAGAVTITSNGAVTVTGLDAGEEATVTVRATARSGSSDIGSASTTVTGAAEAARQEAEQEPGETPPDESPADEDESTPEVTQVVQRPTGTGELPATGLPVPHLLGLVLALVAAGSLLLRWQPAAARPTT